MCPPWTLLICLLEFLPHLKVCLEGHETWAISVHSVVQKTLPEWDLPGNNILLFLHVDYVSGLQLWAIFSEGCTRFFSSLVFGLASPDFYHLLYISVINLSFTSASQERCFIHCVICSQKTNVKGTKSADFRISSNFLGTTVCPRHQPQSYLSIPPP